MRLLRRYLVLIALMFWQGGFTFYVSVVVPMGTAVLRSAQHQGFITRRVTYWLNFIAAVALAVLAFDLLLCRDLSRRRFWARAGLWGLMSAGQVVLFWLHGYLDVRMQDRGRIVLDPEMFYVAHRVYLWTHTVQWLAGLVFVGLMLRAWQREDQRG